MTIEIQPELPPLRVEADGSIRVGSSRIVLEIVIQEYLEGAKPEEISESYPVLTSIEVFGAIAYYLRHRQEVDDYLLKREQKAVENQQWFEKHNLCNSEFREKLIDYRKSLAEKHT